MKLPEKPRILVVDDGPANVELLKSYLQPDYEMLTACNEFEALEIIHKEVPDIVLIDVMMPDMDGYAVCGQIKNSKITQFIPVILITALSGRDEKLKGMQVGADDFLTKPIDRLELQMRVRSLLRIRSLHDELVMERDQAKNYFDVAAVMMLVTDINADIVLINDKGLDILGYQSKEAVLGKNLFHEIIHPGCRSDMQSYFFSLLNDNECSVEYYESSVLSGKQNECIVSWYSKVLYAKDNTATGVLFSGQDITASKKAEEKLKDLTIAMEASIDGMATMDEKRIYSYVNQAYASIFGYDGPKDLIGKKWDVLFFENEIERFNCEILPDFIMNGKWKGELPGKKKDGSSFVQETSLTAIDKGLISVVRDVSERKEVESKLNNYALELKRSNELKDLFTDILHHDLLNPAGVVKGFTDMLLNEETDDNRKYKLRLIENNISKLIGMIESAAEFSRLEEIDKLDFKHMDLAYVVKCVIDDHQPHLAASFLKRNHD